MNKEKQTIADCDNCYTELKERTEEVIGGFKIQSEAVLTDFVQRTSETVHSANLKFATMGENFTKFLSDSETKQEVFLERMERRHNIMIGMNLFLLGLFATAIAILWASNGQKANKNEVLSLKDAQKIIETGDAYRDQRYVLKSGETIDKYNYMWLMETIFERSSRSAIEVK